MEPPWSMAASWWTTFSPAGESAHRSCNKVECAMSASVKLEFAHERKLRARNKLSYRFNHWPIWIAVFFLVPGPLTFHLFAHGFNSKMAAWFGVVLIGTGIAGLFGKLPGVEPAPYIIRFTEDRP